MKPAACIIGGSLAIASLAGAGNASARSSHQVLHLVGKVLAVETRQRSLPDAGNSFGVQGQGALKPLGHVSATGHEHSVGFILKGIPSGQLTLADSSGTIAVQLMYVETRGFAPLPKKGHYRITGGTGAYGGATGSGAFVRNRHGCKVASACVEETHVTFVFK